VEKMLAPKRNALFQEGNSTEKGPLIWPEGKEWYGEGNEKRD